MTILVVGASGATGRLLVEQLLNRGHNLRVIVRSPERLPDYLKNRELLSVIRASVLELSDIEMAQHVRGCDAVASCLGHNLNLKGIYGYPRRLVTEATQRLCHAIKANEPDKPIKYVLMNTSGNRNRDLQEPVSTGHKCVVGLIRFLVPPQVDNEKEIEWVAVRPDGLVDEDKVTKYEVHPSPIRDPIFNPGQTSRINVAHFMADLITDDNIWCKWKGKMPVIYNKE